MRKVLILSALAGLVLTTGTGCLKDENFEDQEYGLQVAEVKGVSFPQKLKSPVVVGLVSQAASQTVNGPLLALDANEPPSSAVTVTLQIDNSLLAAAGKVAMPVGSFSINSLTVVVPAGTRVSDALKITVPNATVLDPSQPYGVGFRITAVDQGYKIAANMSTMVIAFTIKNQYDGVYHAEGYFYHPTGPRLFSEDKDVLTVNGTTSEVFLGDLGTAGYVAHFTVDGANNVTIVTAPGAVGGPYTMFTAGLPSSNPGYTNSWPGGPQCNNTYDPATKTFYVRYGYMGANGWRVTEEKITRL
ncbi:MAG TPA: DUF1735 domain-containing protein [Chitinophagaceae bacterium]